jgi:hypothetical protein
MVIACVLSHIEAALELGSLGTPLRRIASGSYTLRCQIAHGWRVGFILLDQELRQCLVEDRSRP